MFVYLLTYGDCYDIMQKYRRESCLYFLPYNEVEVRRYSLCGNVRRITRLRRGVVCSEVAAWKEAWREPTRAVKENRVPAKDCAARFCGKRKHNRAILATVLAPLRGKRSLCWRGRRWAYFVVQFFQSKPLLFSPEKDVRWKGFISVQFFCGHSHFKTHF